MLWDRSPVFMYLHIPKCLGTTLTHTIGRGIRASAHVFETDVTRSEIKRLVHVRANERRVSVRRLRAIHGHAVFEGLHDITRRQGRYVTFLRDPIERQVSLYNYYRTISEATEHPNAQLFRNFVYENGKYIEFPDWIERETGRTNIMARSLAFASATWRDDRFPFTNDNYISHAKALLRKMHFIGFVENADQDMAILCKMLEIAPPKRKLNISKKYFKFADDPKLRQRILELHAFDQEVFELGQTIRGRQQAISLPKESRH